MDGARTVKGSVAKAHRSRVHALISLLLVANSSVLGQSNRAPRLPDDFKDELEASIKDKIAHHGLPSIAISVMQNGRILYEAGFGLSYREAKMKAMPSTPYAVASITKAFVGTALIMLSAQEKVDLDLPVNRYLKTSQVHSPFGDSSGATVRLVASHTAGLTSYERVCMLADPLCHASPDTAINRYGILFWNPGDHFDYSNLGYGILGEVVSDVSEQPLSKVLENRIFRPFGMGDCYLPVAGAIRPRSAASYDAGSGLRSPITVSDTPGASSAFCSAHDLATFGSVILNPGARISSGVLTDSQVNKLVYSYDASAGVRYSFGWFEQAANGHSGFMAQGGTSEAFAVQQLIPDADLVIAVVTNTGFEYPSTVVKSIAAKLLSAQNAKIAKSEESKVAPEHPLSGRRTGLVHTWQGDVPLALTIASQRDLSVKVGATVAPCKNAEVSATRIYCLGHGDLKTADGPTAPYDFDLEVILHKGALVGAATTSGKTQLPYLVTLSADKPEADRQR